MSQIPPHSMFTIRIKRVKALSAGLSLRLISILGAALLLISCSSTQSDLDIDSQQGFVNLLEYMDVAGEHIQLDVRYFSSDNFVGMPIDGYKASKIYISVEAAQALVAVQKSLSVKDLGLKVFDAYRPQRSVDHFVRWARDISDTTMKSKYYPNVDKENLFRDGYMAERSGHSRGSTIDLTLYSVKDGKELDMGTSWDFFDLSSWPSSDLVSAQQKDNRMVLRDAMATAGFNGLPEEWWHFTLKNEPYPDRYFDFEIK